MLVDCQTCPVRDVHCADCMVTALTAIPVFMADGSPGASLHGGPAGAEAMAPGAVGPNGPWADGDAGRESVPLDRAERRAVSALLAAGLVSAPSANAARAVLDPVVPVAVRRTRRAV